MKPFPIAFLLCGFTTITAESTEIMIFLQRQTGISQITNTNFIYNSKSIELIFEPKQSQISPIFQWSLGIGSDSNEQTAYDPGPGYSIRRVQPSTYLSSGLRFQTPGNNNVGVGFQFRLRGDQLRGGSDYNKERQNTLEGVLLLYGKGLLPIPNSSLKIVIGVQYGFIATNFPYPNREIAIFSGLRFKNFCQSLAYPSVPATRFARR